MEFNPAIIRGPRDQITSITNFIVNKQSSNSGVTTEQQRHYDKKQSYL